VFVAADGAQLTTFDRAKQPITTPERIHPWPMPPCPTVTASRATSRS
jgi:hypothetical protein